MNPLKIEIEHRILKAVDIFSSEDSTRFTLCGVLLEITSKETAIVTATDGRRLIKIRAKVATEGYEKPTRVIIPSALINARIPSIKKGNPEMPQSKAYLTIENGYVSISDFKGETTIKMLAIDGKYPNTAQVIPRNLKPAVRPAIAFGLYGDLAKVASHLGLNIIGATFYQQDESLPYFFVADWQPYEVVVIAMPIRAIEDNNPVVPIWSYQEFEEAA